MDSLVDTATLAALAAGAAAVNEYIPIPFMDEIFHIPQTQAYCAGRWLEWDDKITTPPGLYILGVAAGKLAGGCSTQTLRAVNIVGLTLGSWLVARLTLMGAFSYLVTFPLLYFFSLLYYTDVWSTLLVIIAISLTLRKFHWLSSLVFTISLAFRQTNIVWAGFATVCALMDLDLNLARLNARSGMESLIYQFMGACQNLVRWKTWVPYLLSLVSFVAFLCLNGGITMGDKSNHQMSLNFAQLLYFALFGAFFSFPLLVRKANWIKLYAKNRLTAKGLARYAIELGVLYCIAFKLAVVHPFILADNRHYTFYLWRRVLYRADGLSVVLIPVYHLCISWMFDTPFCLHTLFFWLGLAAALVPSPLLEPRYFMVGFLLWRLFIAKQRISRWEHAWNMLISAVTAYVFCVSEHHFMW